MNIQRWDSIRYFIMHLFGGIYIDVDYECKSPEHNFDDLFNRYPTLDWYCQPLHFLGYLFFFLTSCFVLRELIFPFSYYFLGNFCVT